MNKKYDFMISGAGLVGALTAIQLSKNGYSCCLIEKKKLSRPKIYNDYAPLSLNYRSFLILKEFGLWQLIKKYAYPVKRLQIKSFNSLNRLSFESKDIGLDVLGYVVDRRLLLATFIEVIRKESNVNIIENDHIRDLETKIDSIYTKSHLISKEVIESKSIIVSDGADSKIKNILNIESKVIDYSQTSYIYNARGSFINNSALQIFNKYGIFAAIPYQEGSLNLVLSINNEYEDKFFSDGEVNIDILNEIFKGYIQKIHDLSFVSKYPLITTRANQIVKNNIILIGNSSQLLHPVGAQGFNLALRNIDSFIKKTNKKFDFDDLSHHINIDRESVFSSIDFATNIFANNRLPSKALTFAACNLLKSSPLLKLKFLEKILGIYNYPYLSIGVK